jgi:hypothetical protein
MAKAIRNLWMRRDASLIKWMRVSMSLKMRRNEYMSNEKGRWLFIIFKSDFSVLHGNPRGKRWLKG